MSEGKLKKQIREHWFPDEETPYPLIFADTVFKFFDEAKQDAPIRFVNGRWEHISGKPISYEKYRSAMLDWFEKWFGSAEPLKEGEAEK